MVFRQPLTETRVEQWPKTPLTHRLLHRSIIRSPSVGKRDFIHRHLLEVISKAADATESEQPPLYTNPLVVVVVVVVLLLLLVLLLLVVVVVYKCVVVPG